MLKTQEEARVARIRRKGLFYLNAERFDAVERILIGPCPLRRALLAAAYPV
jgi:hypothetical protein